MFTSLNLHLLYLRLNLLKKNMFLIHFNLVLDQVIPQNQLFLEYAI